MNLFGTIKQVLDEQFVQLGDTNQDRIEIVKASLTYLSSGYESLLLKNSIIYKNLAVRFAYIYRYVTCHSGMAFQVIRDSKVLRSLFKQKILTVSCIGGGPGSDLLGVLKYAEEVLADWNARPLLYQLR
jgi:hypothetical protein